MNEELIKIIEGCKKQKYRAQKALYDRYAPLLFGVCMRYFKDSNDAADALQEGFIKIYDSIGSFKGDGSFEGWIKRIQVNLCLMELRKNKKLIYVEEMHEVSDEESEEADYLTAYSSNQIFEAIENLPSGCQTIFNLYAIDGFNHREIATTLAISEGTSKSQFSRAKKILKEQLLKQASIAC